MQISEIIIQDIIDTLNALDPDNADQVIDTILEIVSILEIELD